MEDILFLDGNLNFKHNTIMNTKHLFITLLFTTVQMINAQEKTSTMNSTQGHIHFLEDFYTEYISSWDTPYFYETKKDILKKYCTLSLLGKIYVAKIDGDPFIFAQDIPSIVLDYLRVEKYGEQKNVYEVSYHYLNEGDSDRTRIRLEVINTSEGYKISNIISNYDKEKGLYFPLGRQ